MQGITLQEIILARLLTAVEKGCTASEIDRSLEPFCPSKLTKSQWKKSLEEQIDTLLEEGLLDSLGRSRFTLTFLGKEQIKNKLKIPDDIANKAQWKIIKDCYLAVKALGLSEQASNLQREYMATTEGLKATILCQHYFSELLDKEQNVSAKGDLEKIVSLLVAKITGSQSTHQDHLRLAVIKRALEKTIVGKESYTKTELPKGFNLEAFAIKVKEAAKKSQTGWFGNNKVFISHVWQQLKQEGGDFGLTEEQYKNYLITASRQRLLRLARADLPDAANKNDVRSSEISYLTGIFHFILLA